MFARDEDTQLDFKILNVRASSVPKCHTIYLSSMNDPHLVYQSPAPLKNKSTNKSPQIKKKIQTVFLFGPKLASLRDMFFFSLIQTLLRECWVPKNLRCKKKKKKRSLPQIRHFIVVGGRGNVFSFTFKGNCIHLQPGNICFGTTQSIWHCDQTPRREPKSVIITPSSEQLNLSGRRSPESMAFACEVGKSTCY